jgi:hypothetical protein
MLRTLSSQAKDLSAASAKDRRQLTKARVFTQEDVVHLREERQQMEAEKSARVEARKRKQTATASKTIEGSSTTSHREMQHSMVKCAGTNLPKAESYEDKDLVDEEWVSEGESEGEEDSCIPASGLFDDLQARDDGEVAGMVGMKVEIVTRSGRRAGRVIYS